MRLSRLAMYVGTLGVLGSLLLFLATPFLSWKAWQSAGMHYWPFANVGISVLAFFLALVGLAIERDSASARTALRCFVFLLVAAAAFVLAMFAEIARHPV